MAKKANIRIVRPGERPAYDREKANHGVLRRTTAIMLVCGVLLFLPLFYQLFTLMIVDHDKYESAAISNQTRTTAVPADRGTIYDRNMKIIAASSTGTPHTCARCASSCRSRSSYCVQPFMISSGSRKTVSTVEEAAMIFMLRS